MQITIAPRTPQPRHATPPALQPFSRLLISPVDEFVRRGISHLLQSLRDRLIHRGLLFSRFGRARTRKVSKWGRRALCNVPTCSYPPSGLLLSDLLPRSLDVAPSLFSTTTCSLCGAVRSAMPRCDADLFGRLLSCPVGPPLAAEEMTTASRGVVGRLHLWRERRGPCAVDSASSAGSLVFARLVDAAMRQGPR